MIYLLALFVEWVRRALVPAAAVFAIATLAAIGVRLIFGRSRLTTNVWLALGIAVVAVFGWRTFEVWQDFSHPQYRNFRSYVADPIPRDARALVMDSPAPAMFYDGALVRFEGPASLVTALARNTLKGARTLAVLRETKQRSKRSTVDTLAVTDADGSSYRRINPATFPAQLPETFAWARWVIDEQTRGGADDIYVLLLAGPWGRFESVLSYDRDRSRVAVRQNMFATASSARHSS